MLIECSVSYINLCTDQLKPHIPYLFRDTYRTADHIISNVFLGNECAAKDYDFLKSNSIDGIISMAKEYEKNSNDMLHHIQYFSYGLWDNENGGNEEIATILNNAADTIAELVDNNNNILVYCYLGKSISAAAIIAYLLKYRREFPTYSSAYSFVRKFRPIIAPKRYFEAVLREYFEYINRGSYVPSTYQELYILLVNYLLLIINGN